ncbi:MAG: hypothetical protein IJ466_07250 [Clostridia bacterium]|nr:hypothetical protein [Clostridia bacterium]
MKKIAILIILATVAITLSACTGNYNVIDTKYSFDKAIIKMPDGEIKEIQVKSWSDAEGEQLTITSNVGRTYLVSSYNCVMIDN